MLEKSVLERTFLSGGNICGLKNDLKQTALRGHQVLSYNQSLVQFADTKANTLIMINSIFLASTTSFLFNASYIAHPLLLIFFFLAAGASILYCLAVVTARSDCSDIVKRKDLIFFGDIAERKNVDNFLFEALHISDKLYCEDILRRIYMVSDIAGRKYRTYSIAQRITVLASILWLISIMCFLLSKIL